MGWYILFYLEYVKKHLQLFLPLSMESFLVNLIVKHEMNRLKIIIKYELKIACLKLYHVQFMIIKLLNNHYLSLHFDTFLLMQIY
jgi:hypothetical protein